MGATVPHNQFPFVGPTSLEYSSLLSAERSINLYYEPAYGPTGAPALIGTPGLGTPLATLAHTPVRGLGLFGGQLVAVGGAHFYSVDPSAGTILKDITLPGANDGGYNFAYILANPQNPGSNVYIVCDTAQPEIISVDLVGNTATARFAGFGLEFLDGFYVTIAIGVNNAQINCSAFNDGTTWPALAFAIREYPDNLVGLAVVNNLLWVFGNKYTDIWYNAGLPNFPFARINSAVHNVGCMIGSSIAKVLDTALWLGSSSNSTSAVGWGKVYMAVGTQPVVVSTPAIEQIINKSIRGVALTSVNGYGYEEAGHAFYCLNIPQSQFPAATGNGLTLAYDLTTKQWAERQFYNGGTPVMAQPWLIASLVGGNIGTSTAKTFAGISPGATNGAGTQGAICPFGLQFFGDNGSSIQRTRIAPHIQNGLRWTRYPSFEVHADIGSAQMTLTYSNDGGVTFPTLNRSDRTISGQTPANPIGAYKQFRWRQCGRARKRAMGVQILDGANPIVIIDGILKASIGTEE